MRFFSRVSFTDKLLFTKHLSVMIRSGITTAEALHSLEQQSRPGLWKDTLQAVVADIENGNTLAYAFGKHPQVFDTMYVNLVAVGEGSGTLQESLAFLTRQMTKSYSLRKKVQGILLYPTIVLTVAFLMSAGISLFILPKLADLFRSFDVALPLPTRILLFFSDIMRTHGGAIFLGIAVFFIVFRIIVRMRLVKPYWHRLLLRLPLLGPFLTNVALTSICRDMGIMLQSGLPLVSALRTEHASTENMVFQKYLSEIESSVGAGETISKTLESGKFEHIPSLAAKMIAVGEKTGKLEESFLYLGDFFEEETDAVSKNFSAVLEPLLLLMVGLIVAFVALAVISPIYTLTGSVKR